MKTEIFDEVINRIFPIRNILNDFDYPNYGGLPKNIYCKLSPEAVDAMQHILNYKFDRKRSFASAYKFKLLELGESILPKIKKKRV